MDSFQNLTGPLVCLGECMVEFRRDGPDCWRQGFAGDSLNVAWALAALSACPVDYATLIGTDAISDAMLAFIAGAGIGTDRIGRVTDRSVGLYTIATDDRGERSFSYWRGESAARLLAAKPGAVAARLHGAGLVYLSGISAAILGPEGRDHLLADLATLRGQGVRIVYDPNYRPRLWPDAQTMRRFTRQMIGLCDLVLPTFDDEAAAFGDTDAAASLSRLSDWGATEVVVKNGPDATLIGHQGQVLAVAPPAALLPLDTTGAGDSFNGAYLAARLIGLSPAQAARRAHAVAAGVVMTPGALVAQSLLRDRFAGDQAGT